MRTVHHLVLAVLVVLVEDGGGAVRLLDPEHLAGDDVERLVPADALVLADAPVLDVAAARPVEPVPRIEVHPLHGVADAAGENTRFL